MITVCDVMHAAAGGPTAPLHAGSAHLEDRGGEADSDEGPHGATRVRGLGKNEVGEEHDSPQVCDIYCSPQTPYMGSKKVTPGNTQTLLGVLLRADGWLRSP